MEILEKDPPKYPDLGPALTPPFQAMYKFQSIFFIWSFLKLLLSLYCRLVETIHHREGESVNSLLEGQVDQPEGWSTCPESKEFTDSPDLWCMVCHSTRDPTGVVFIDYPRA